MELNPKSLMALAVLLTVDVAMAGALRPDCCSQSQALPEIQKTFSVTGAGDLRVNAISGDVTVVADSPGAIRLVARETVRGDSDADLAQARRDFTLDTGQHGDEVAICVNGPGRGAGRDSDSDAGNAACKSGGWSWGGDRHEAADFTLELHVPPRAAVRAGLVNGNLHADRLAGDFALRSVNGAIELRDAGGAGSAATVNGEVRAAFTHAPTGDLSFSSVNGSLHLYFPPGLNAALRYSTLNGQVYTDFPVAPPSDHARAMAVLTRRHAGSGTIGNGGAALRVSTVNGTIYLHKQS